MFPSVTAPCYRSPRPETSGFSCSKRMTPYPIFFILSASTACLFCLKKARPRVLALQFHPQDHHAGPGAGAHDSCRCLNASLPPTTTHSLSDSLRTALSQGPAQTPSVTLSCLSTLPPSQGSHYRNPQLTFYSPTSISSPVKCVSFLPVATQSSCLHTVTLI